VPLSFFEVTYAVFEGKNKNDREITDIKSAIDNIISQPNLMLNGEPVPEHIITSLTAVINIIYEIFCGYVNNFDNLPLDLI
jgi:hypothetical protein